MKNWQKFLTVGIGLSILLSPVAPLRDLVFGDDSQTSTQIVGRSLPSSLYSVPTFNKSLVGSNMGMGLMTSCFNSTSANMMQGNMFGSMFGGQSNMGSMGGMGGMGMMGGMGNSCGNTFFGSNVGGGSNNPFSSGKGKNNGGDIMSQMMGQGFGMSMTGLGFQMNCGQGSEAGVNTSSLSCQSITDPSGNLNLSLLKGQMQMAQQACFTLQCKKTKMNFISGELSCLTNNANALQQQMSQLKVQYDQNIHAMQNQMQQIKADEADKQGQVDFLNNRLGGNKQTGAIGLIDLKNATNNMVSNELPANIRKVDLEVKTIAQARQNLEEMIQTRRMGLTSECFAQEDTGFHCELSQTAYSARNRPKSDVCKYGSWCDFLLCRYWENLSASSSSNGYQTGVSRKNNTSQTQALQDLLETIMSFSPNNSSPPANPQDAVTQASQPNYLFSPQQIDKAYGSQLAQFNNAGLDVRGLVNQVLNRCYNRANTVVQTERGRASTLIGKQIFDINTNEDNVKAEMSAMLDKYTQHISEIYAGLTGKAMTINPKGCQNTVPATSVACLQNLKDYMTGLLSGSGPQGGFQISVPANNQKNLFTINCFGLNGCVKDMQNKLESINLEKQAMTQAKTQFVNQAKQATEDYTNYLAQQFNIQNQALTNHIRDINEALRQVGLPPINVRNVDRNSDAAQIQLDEDKLPKSPNDVAALIGARMNPPMLDVNSGSFSNTLSQVGRGVNQYDDKLAQVTQAIMTMQTLPTQCLNQVQSNVFNQLQNNANNLANCGSNYVYCVGISSVNDQPGKINCPPNNGGTGQGIVTGSGAGVNPAVSNLMSDFNKMFSGGSTLASFSSISSVLNGIPGSCENQTIPAFTNFKNEYCAKGCSPGSTDAGCIQLGNRLDSMLGGTQGGIAAGSGGGQCQMASTNISNSMTILQNARNNAAAAGIGN